MQLGDWLERTCTTATRNTDRGQRHLRDSSAGDASAGTSELLHTRRERTASKDQSELRPVMRTHPGVLHRPAALGVVLLLAAVAALGFPASSLAGCGGVETASPSHRVDGQLPPLAVGDSTLLLSQPGLAAAGFTVNAHGCREFPEALALLAGLRGQGALPHMVVVFLGANGSVTPADIQAALGVLGSGRLLVLVTPRQLGGDAGINAVIEHQAARRYPGRILLLDWVADSAGHPGWFQPDGLHLTYPGVDALNALIKHALPYAYVIPGC